MIKDPKSVNIHELQPDDIIPVGLGAVAVIGYGNDWVVYVKRKRLSANEIEGIAKRGDKVTEHVAQALFPRIAQSGRRYRQ